ncbi:MAG: MBL fold metallo-hydrolase [Candidatus Moranbacteria bacterium]|nr:MBL fold metallo-hydrolase [Candidatus Moranbacteria bacterium]
MLKILIFLNCLGIVIILKIWLFFLVFQTNPEFEVAVFDVGQGDCFLIKLKNTTLQILIDAGDGSTQNLTEKLAKEMPLADKTIDIIILTHPHQDHVGGIPSILEEFETNLIIETGVDFENKTYDNFEEIVDLKQIPRLYAARGEKILIGENFVLEILHPFFSKSSQYKNVNDSSIVFLSKFKEKKALFTGDIELEGEKEMLDYLKSRQDLELENIDLLKTAHHGSKTSTSKEFLDLIRPRQAIISCARKNSFNHPATETIQLLNYYQVELKRTYQDGDIIFKF